MCLGKIHGSPNNICNKTEQYMELKGTQSHLPYTTPLTVSRKIHGTLCLAKCHVLHRRHKMRGIYLSNKLSSIEISISSAN